MESFFFDGEITAESVITMIKTIDDCEDEEVTIYFTSNGGDMAYADVLIHYFNSSDKTINLILHWGILSAAMEVAVRTTCSKEILSDAYGGFHLASRGIEYRDLQAPVSHDSFLLKEVEAFNNRWLKLYGSSFSKDEMKHIQKGDTIFLNHARFVDFINKYSVKDGEV